MQRHSSLKEASLRNGDSISCYRLRYFEKKVLLPTEYSMTGISQIQQSTGVSPSIFLSIITTCYNRNIHRCKPQPIVSTHFPAGSRHQPQRATQAAPLMSNSQLWPSPSHRSIKMLLLASEWSRPTCSSHSDILQFTGLYNNCMRVSQSVISGLFSLLANKLFLWLREIRRRSWETF